MLAGPAVMATMLLAIGRGAVADDAVVRFTLTEGPVGNRNPDAVAGEQACYRPFVDPVSGTRWTLTAGVPKAWLERDPPELRVLALQKAAGPQYAALAKALASQKWLDKADPVTTARRVARVLALKRGPAEIRPAQSGRPHREPWELFAHPEASGTLDAAFTALVLLVQSGVPALLASYKVAAQVEFGLLVPGVMPLGAVDAVSAPPGQVLVTFLPHAETSGGVIASWTLPEVGDMEWPSESITRSEPPTAPSARRDAEAVRPNPDRQYYIAAAVTTLGMGAAAAATLVTRRRRAVRRDAERERRRAGEFT